MRLLIIVVLLAPFCLLLCNTISIVTLVTMGKNQDLTPEKRGAIRKLKEMGLSLRQVASKCGVSKTAVSQLLKRDEMGVSSYTKRCNLGRICKTTRHDDRMLLRIVNKDPNLTIRQMREEVLEVLVR